MNESCLFFAQQWPYFTELGISQISHTAYRPHSPLNCMRKKTKRFIYPHPESALDFPPPEEVRGAGVRIRLLSRLLDVGRSKGKKTLKARQKTLRKRISVGNFSSRLILRSHQRSSVVEFRDSRYVSGNLPICISEAIIARRPRKKK